MGQGIRATIYTDYHYYEDLANAATYTPPAQTLATLFLEAGDFDAAGINVELWDGGGWVCSQPAIAVESRCSLNQDVAQSLRIINDSGAAAIKISLTGVTWS